MAHTPMSRENRAKQFLPFAALKGFEEAIHAKERIVVPRSELSQERMEELDRNMHEIQRADMVTVVYFCKGEYLKTTGMVAKIDTDARYIRVVNTKIAFDDIYEIARA